jgi:hypothetical protein
LYLLVLTKIRSVIGWFFNHITKLLVFMDVKDFFLNFMGTFALYSAIMLSQIAKHDLDTAMLVRGVAK